MKYTLFALLLISTSVMGQNTIPKTDTVKVVMLLIDMSSTFPQSRFAIWQYGYKVNNGYLDKKKKPLGKDIIVWDSKTIQ